MKSKLGKLFSGFKKGWLLLVILVLIVPISPAMSKQVKVKTMTRNLYLGADIFKIFKAAQADPASVPDAVAEVFQTMLNTNFSARAEGIADEIAHAKPDVIGLQEVSTFYIQTPGDFVLGNLVQAHDVVIDFYAVLDAALKARGLYYDAFMNTTADVELPMTDAAAGSPYYLSDVRMVDHNVVLVRKGHPVSKVFAENYALNLNMNLGDAPVEFTRGFLVVDTEIKGESYRLVDTHLEIESDPGSIYRYVQSVQMQQLLGYLGGLALSDPKPIIMVGDFNSSPEDVPGTYVDPKYGPLPYEPPYMRAVDAGYQDAWLLQKEYDEGYTDGFDEYVSDPNAQLTARIDFIFLDPYDLMIHKVKCDVVGDEVSDIVPNPDDPGSYLWPSDHAGVVAKVKFSTHK